MKEAEENIPDGWVRTTIGAVCTAPQYGYTTKASDTGDLHLLRTTDITSGRIDWDTVPFCSDDPDDPARYLLEDGDVVVSRAGSVGVSHLVATPRRSVFASYLIRFRPLIDRRFFRYFLDSPAYWRSIAGKKLGVAIPNVNATRLKSIPLPLPPLEEQERIVERLDELLSELERGVECLETARAQLEVCRQALFKHAFEGRLTVEWREAFEGPVEGVDALLARVSRLRQSREEEELAAWKNAVDLWKQRSEHGPKPSKPQRFKPLDPLDPNELASLPTIPEGWSYVRLAEIAQIGSGMSVSSRRKVEDPVEVPYLRVANVQRGHLVLDEIKTMTIERSQLPRLQLARWDVLFNEGGDRDKLGRGWIWEGQVEPCVTQNHVFRARPILSSELNSKWLSYWGNSFGQRYFDTEGKQTTNLASINKSVLSRFPVPLPPMQEQEVIVQRLEEKMTVVDNLDAEIGMALSRLEILRKVILKRAFDGRLVAQDPQDEPACVLLNRIQADREAESKSKNKKRKAAS